MDALSALARDDLALLVLLTYLHPGDGLARMATVRRGRSAGFIVAAISVNDQTPDTAPSVIDQKVYVKVLKDTKIRDINGGLIADKGNWAHDHL